MNKFDVSDLSQKAKEQFDDEFKAARAAMKKPNILILGATGIGKSTIVNKLFGEELAAVGAGRPVTQDFKLYEGENSSVNLYDSKGWELGENAADEFYSQVKAIRTSLANQSSEKQLHVLWYVLHCKIEDEAARFIKEDLKGLPVVIVISKADALGDSDVEEIRLAIESHHIENLKGIVEVSAAPPIRRGGKTGETFGLEELVKLTHQIIPDAQRMAFVAQQRVLLSLKSDEAKKSVLKYAGSAAIVGLSPIPFSDAPILIALQIKMAARIAAIYGANTAGVGLGAFVVSLVAAQLAPMAIGNLLKFIPIFGTFIAGTINGTVAFSITIAMGRGLIKMMDIVYKNALDGKQISMDGDNSALERVFEEGFKSDAKTLRGKSQEQILQEGFPD